MALTLTQVTAYDKADKAIAPVSTRMSSQASHGRVSNCHDGNSTDEKYCQSQKTKDKDPWLVFGYRADANISKIVVVNRAAAADTAIRIVGASIRICSDSGLR